MTEPLTYAGRALLAAIKAHDFLEAESAILAIEAEAATPPALDRSWHDGMTLVTHPDGTRCWHRPPQWADAATPPALDVETIKDAFHDARRLYVQSPEQGADACDGAIADALWHAERAILAALSTGDET